MWARLRAKVNDRVGQPLHRADVPKAASRPLRRRSCRTLEPMPTNDELREGSEKMAALVAGLRSRAAQESDPAEARSLLASADKFEKTSRDARARIASMQASIDRAKAQVEASRRPKEVSWWAAVAVILGVIVLLSFIGLAPRP